MATELQFSAIKDELTTLCDGVIKKYLEGKNYDQKEAQSIINQIVDEIIKNLHSNHKELKWIVNGTVFQKGDSSLHYSSTCLWNPNTDGSTTKKYENDTLHAFVNVFGIVP